MSRQNEWAAGQWHLNVRFYGPPQKIELLHAVLFTLEGDWPWKPRCVKTSAGIASGGYYYDGRVGLPAVKVCEGCLGVVMNAPRITPADIKAAGKQFGVKVKVDRMAEADHCCTTKDGIVHFPKSTHLDANESRKLYMHKRNRLRIEERRILVGHQTLEDLKLIESGEKAPVVIPAGVITETIQ